ncbi:MAG: hypothetical protein LBS53_11930 [Synergistaceae bacterium]|jgi:beta-1,4-mannosyl-glycoprotein beta-1,4-N-acetylglucosaminyltransferase|nr:hypothetical protein [Synergistaceae bacterium]
MVYDCFPFFDELDLLEIRLNVLSPVVDKFVLVEADRTFSNKKKPLYFEENKQRYEPFLEKIIHVKINDYPFKYNSAWDNDAYQRNKIDEGLRNCEKDDIVIISDIDEIPNPDEVIKYKNGVYGKGLFSLRQVLFYYFLNYQKAVEKYWCFARIMSYQTYFDRKYTPNGVRFPSHATDRQTDRDGIIKNGGWHFSYLGGYEAIKYKIQSFAHQEFNNEKFINEKIIEKVANGYDLFDRKGWRFIPVKIKSPDFPQYIVDNQIKYADFIYPKINYLHNAAVYISLGMYFAVMEYNPAQLVKILIKKMLGADKYKILKQRIREILRL